MNESYRSIGDSPDYRALCEELADKMAACWPLTFDPPDCLKRARAALDEPEPEVVGPTPSNQLVEQWIAEVWHEGTPVRVAESDLHIAARAAEWGARWGRAGLADGPVVPEGREPASVVEEPSDKELLELMPETMRDEFSYAAKVCADATGGQVKPGIFHVCLNTAALEYARAILARWGRSVPVPPAEGEVADEARYLARELRDQADDLSPSLELFGLMHRAADLLEQRHPAPAVAGEGPSFEEVEELCEEHCFNVEGYESIECLQGLINDALARYSHHPAPVPVSERLPGPEDCDAEGRCWVGGEQFAPGDPTWILGFPAWAERFPGIHRYWLPAHALPLPQGEMES